jgi:iron(III) transport system substrate-binding protein
LLVNFSAKLAVGSLLVGCVDRDALVVYTALDSEFSEPVLERFSRETGVKVRTRFDTESTKTVGLTESIINEARVGNARCDVFWNNEILNTLRLERRGLLDVYVSPQHDVYPEAYRSGRGTWHGFAARARVLVVNTRLVTEQARPTSILDLADSAWRARAGIAKPLFGTTATHAACLFAAWGDAKAKDYFRALRRNEIAIESGNKQVALRVGSGQLAIGLTDTDDVMVALRKGMPVAIVYPDADEGELGTLFIPNTLAVLKNARHPDKARRLIDYLLSPEVERRLAEGPSAQIPLNPNVDVPLDIKTPAQVRAMRVSFEEAANKWDTAAQFLREEFLMP